MVDANITATDQNHKSNFRYLNLESFEDQIPILLIF